MAHVVVVGAGLVGATSAVELRRRGHAVTLLERAVPGAEASSAAGGILSPQAECDSDGPFLALCLAGLDATRALVREIEQDAGVDAQLDEDGTELVAQDDHERAALAARMEWQRARGLEAEWLQRGERALFPREGRLDPRGYTLGALALARQRGAAVVSDDAVDRVLQEGGRARGVALRSGRVVDADCVVVAAGAWSSQVDGARVSAEQVFPVRGQMMELQGAPGLLPRVVFFTASTGKAYAIPRRDGHIVLGSTMEHVGFDKRTTDEGLARVHDNACRALPILRDVPVTRAWAGLRPATRDGLPLLGQGALPGLFLSTGHFRNGVLLAAVSAQISAQWVDGEAPSLDLAPFSPQRLAMR